MADDQAQTDITLFGRTNFRNTLKPFGIKLDDRRRHMYVIGKTGMGKSTLLENMIVQDIRAGRGLTVVDPHGDLVEKVLKYVPSYRVNDIIYLNPADVDYPIAFNILEAINPNQRHLVSAGLIAVFKKMWIDSWGPRLEYILNNTILALIEYPGSTLLGVNRMLVDKEYRGKVVRHISDPIVKSFWQTEFTAYANQFRTEAIAPIQNKIGQFLSSAIIRNIVGQPKSTIDMREIMDSGKILLLNLAKGRIGETNSALLGAMMITKLQVAAMSRIDAPESERRDFFLYVDEFQNFATESFANILSEARKYRLDLIIAHQYIEQLDETVRAAVFGNVGTIVCFRVGAADAEFLAKEFMPVFTETDLVNLTKYDMYLKLMIDGVASDPFSATGLPPITAQAPDDLEETVIQVSRERYAKHRTVVEEKIARWTGVTEPAEGEGLKSGSGGLPGQPPGGGTDKPSPKDMIVLDRQPVVMTEPAGSISLADALRSGPRPGQGRGQQRSGDRSPRPGAERRDRPRGPSPRREQDRRSDRHPRREPPVPAAAPQVPVAPPPVPPTPTSPFSPTSPHDALPPAAKGQPLKPGEVVHPG